MLGSLRNQLLYSSVKAGITDSELEALLRSVNLWTTISRIGGLDRFADWNTLLSTGEQQQLAFARLFLFNPTHAFLDEATSAVDSTTERMIYRALKERVQCYISVGNRSVLSEYHSRILELKEDGSWTVTNV